MDFAEYRFRLGKIKSKYLILDILGFAKYRDQAGNILFKSSKMLRRLLEAEKETGFLKNTEDEEGVELPIIKLG